ncbi:F-actin-monooxygenase MICAL2-like [Rhynchocyon petersi]
MAALFKVTTCSHPREVSRDHSNSSSPTFQGQARAQGTLQKIPLYLPHREILERAEYCLVHPSEDGLTSSRPLSHREMGSEGCQDLETSLKNTRSIHRGPQATEGENRFLTEQPLSLKAEENTRERAASPRRGEGGFEMAEKKPSLKKLALTQEQKTRLLDWNNPTPMSLPLDAGEHLPPKSSGNGKGRVLKPVCPLTLPQATRETQSFHKDSWEKVRTPAEQTGGECSVAPPKSPLRLIANAIRRSLEPLLSSSEGGRKVWAKPKPKTLPPSQLHACARSFSLRRPIYSKDWDQQSPGREVTRRATSSSSLGTPATKTAQPSYVKPPDPTLHAHSLPNRPSKIFPELMSPRCKIEDVPTLLEKVSLQETLTEPSNRRLTFFSSLRLKDKSLENFLQESKQRLDIRDIFGSSKGKVLPVDSISESVHQSNSIALGQTGHSPSGVSGPRHTPIEAQVTEAASSLSSTTSSSADEECDHQPSSCSKRKTLKRKKKLEKATKQLIKQEELKRLHKAQAIQRRLEEVEERLRTNEVQGVTLEKALRGEADSGAHDETQLLQEWFKLVLEKNKLTRYESELLIMAQEVELEDHQSRLEQKLREKMLKEESQKDVNDLYEEQEILTEMMQVIEQRDKLVDSLEEQRIKEKAEDQHFERFIFSRACQLSRT